MAIHLSKRDRGIILRVRASRRAAGIKKWAMAAALDITVDQYSVFERSRAIPIDYLLLFAAMVRCTPGYIITGRSALDPSPPTGNLTAPMNRCGRPCQYGKFWCNPNCPGPLEISPIE